MANVYWDTGDYGDWSQASDWSSSSVPMSDDGVIINNSNVTANNAEAAAFLDLNGSFLTVSDSLNVTGNISFGGQSSGLELDDGSVTAGMILGLPGSAFSLLGSGTVTASISGDSRITAEGGTLTVNGSITGDTSGVQTLTGTTLVLNGSFSGGVMTFAGLNSILKLDVPTTYSSAVAGFSVSDTIDLVGISAVSATYGSGALVINETGGGTYTLSTVTGETSGTTFHVTSDQNGGTIVSLSASAGFISWDAAASGDWSQASDWSSSAVPNSSNDVDINDATVTVQSNTTEAAHSLNLNGSSFTVGGSLTVTGALSLTQYASIALSGGTIAAQSISVGLGSVGTLSGYGTVNASISGDVSINAHGGTLTLGESISGDAYGLFINNYGTLDLKGSVTTSDVGFNGASGTLKLDAPSSFSGTIESFYVGDKIDLVGITATSATYSNGAVVLSETGGRSYTLQDVTGETAGNTFQVANDGTGGTLLTLAPDADLTSTTPLRSGDWSQTAEWSSGVVPTAATNAVIDNVNVTVSDAEAAESLDLNGASLNLQSGGILSVNGAISLSEATPINLYGATLSAASLSPIAASFGYLGGYGTINAAISGGIEISATTGTLIINGSITSDPDGFFVNGGATLELNGAVSAGPVNFNGAGSELKLDTPASFSANLSNISVGDSIDLAGISATSATYSGETLTINETNGGAFTLQDVSGQTAGNGFITSSDKAGGTLVTLEAVCYVRGSRILTPSGERQVEDLAIGDSVVTRFSGIQLIRWIGHQSFPSLRLKTSRNNAPVCVRANSIGPDLPARDLFVSPGHSILIDDILVLAKSLVNGVTIFQTEPPSVLDYFKLDLGVHDCVLAEGVWSETFADGSGLRDRFHNASDFYARFPDALAGKDPIQLCRPRPQRGERLDAVLRPIVARARGSRSIGRLRGRLDEVFGEFVEGWAQDVDNPELPVLLEVVLGGSVLGTALAFNYRQDLQTAGVGQGRASFSFKSPVTIAPESIHSLYVRRLADGAELEVNPDLLTRGQPPRITDSGHQLNLRAA